MAIFHDYLTPSHIALLRDDVREAERAARVVDSVSGGGSELRFVPIDNETFALPPSLAHLRDRIPRSIRGYGMGYRHMCRFFSAAVFSHDAVLPYTYA